MWAAYLTGLPDAVQLGQEVGVSQAFENLRPVGTRITYSQKSTTVIGERRANGPLPQHPAGDLALLSLPERLLVQGVMAEGAQGVRTPEVTVLRQLGSGRAECHVTGGSTWRQSDHNTAVYHPRGVL